MFPKPTGVGVVCVVMYEIAGNGKGSFHGSGKSEDTSQRVFLDEKIARCKCKIVLGNEAGILEAILRMQVAGDGAAVALEIFRCDQDEFPDLEANGEVSRVLKLVADIRTKIGDMPAHA